MPEIDRVLSYRPFVFLSTKGTKGHEGFFDVPVVALLGDDADAAVAGRDSLRS